MKLLLAWLLRTLLLPFFLLVVFCTVFWDVVLRMDVWASRVINDYKAREPWRE